MNPNQVKLIEEALRILYHGSEFDKMTLDPDLRNRFNSSVGVREAAIKILTEAITRTGEFST